MGWCSGTPIFEAVFKVVIDEQIPEAQAHKVISALIDAMENHDWDCHSDSDYIDHPLFMAAMKELHPDDWEDWYDFGEYDEGD